MNRKLYIFSLLALLIGCEENRYDEVKFDTSCSTSSTHDLSLLPDKLSDTGIDGVNVKLYKPQFELWTDGASKRRWISLPNGMQIDSSNMDQWSFPQGTKFWKEFGYNGVKIETRLLYKTGSSDSDWRAVSYIWNEDQTEAYKSISGASNVLGTSHDVPSASSCFACHGGQPSVVLGFSAIQLSYNSSTGIDLNSLISENTLTDNSHVQVEVPGNSVEKDALGYLHANCSHCHNEYRATLAEDCYKPDRSFSFYLSVDDLTVESTNTYKTAVDKFILDRDRIIKLMSQRGDRISMPPLGTEIVDPTGLDKIESWKNFLK